MKAIEDYQDALCDMIEQFAYRGKREGKEVLHTGGLSALEYAFEVLEWPDPIPLEEVEKRREAMTVPPRRMSEGTPSPVDEG